MPFAPIMNGNLGLLADQLGRIASEITTLAGQAAAARPAPGCACEDEVTRARRLLAERRARHAILPEAAAAEPAWAMLLALFVEGSRPLSAKALAIAASAPASTAQRWLEQLAAAGLVDRAVDAADRRRVELSLTPHGRTVVARCLAALTPASR